jgi:hypothetical protein
VFLTATANGIAVFTAFGAGLVAGLLGQIGEAIDFGPFGGAHAGGPLPALWAVGCLVLVGLIGATAFRRRDL